MQMAPFVFAACAAGRGPAGAPHPHSSVFAALTPLSREDIELLATAIVLQGVIATDEKALSELCRDLLSADEDAPQDCIDSLALLHLLEQHGRLSPQQRRNTVATWLRLDTLLPAAWRKRYRALFGESADTL